MDNLTHFLEFRNDSTDLNSSETSVGFKTGTIIPNLDDIALYFRVPDWTVLVAKVSIVVLFVIGTVGNSLLIAGLYRKKEKCSTDIYTIWKAVADLVTVIVNGPVDFVRYTPDLWRLIGSDWLCRLHFYIIHVTVIVSMILVLSIGVDRYWKVFKPYSSINLTKASKRVCLSVLGSSAVYSVVFIFTAHQDHNGQCILHREYKQVNSIAYGTIALILLASSIVLACIYFKIAVFLRNREKMKISKQTKSKMAVPLPKKHGGHDDARSLQLECDRPSSVVSQVTLTSSITTDHSGSTNTVNVSPLSFKMDVHHQPIKGDLTLDYDGFAENDKDKPPIKMFSTNEMSNHVTNQEPINMNSTQDTMEQPIKPGAVVVESTSAGNSMRRVARTTLTMALVTIVFTLTTVLPSVGLCTLSSLDGGSELMSILILLTIRLPMFGNVANPILFAMTSSEFRGIIANMFKNGSTFKRK